MNGLEYEIPVNVDFERKDGWRRSLKKNLESVHMSKSYNRKCEIVTYVPRFPLYISVT